MAENLQHLHNAEKNEWQKKCRHAHGLQRQNCKKKHTHTHNMNSLFEWRRGKKMKCTKLRNASQQTTLIMINMPNKWTLKISSVLSLVHILSLSLYLAPLILFHDFFLCYCIVVVASLLFFFLIAFIGISLHNALCDLFLSCCLLHDYFLSIHLPFGCIMNKNDEKKSDTL